MQDYAKAILAGATNNNLAPTSSPIVTDVKQLAAISGSNASKFAGIATESTGRALAGMADNQADQNMNALKGRIMEAQAREAEAKRMLDPSNYQQIENDSGGYDFVDPNGKKITVDHYARVTGKNRAAILSDSQDPTDVAFVNDYKNLQEILEATVNRDGEKLKAFYQNQPVLKGMKPAELINRFKAYYPGYFTQKPSRRATSGANAFTSSDAASRNSGGGDEDFM